MSEPSDNEVSRVMAGLASRRWAGTTPEQRSEAMAKARAGRNLTPEARAEIGRRLAEARRKARETSGTGLPPAEHA